MKLDYRPEIDGLRAIAVGAVIIYHAQINIFGQKLFQGGFIGVDIFFVISGYLITSIILKELIATKSFSFRYFYERRVRRILPVLLFVIFASLPLAWIYLLPDTFIDFSKSVLYSLGFSSNYYFWYSGQEYGAEKGIFIPFLHTWSLSVEEQFYIIFPVILLISFKYFKKYLIHILILCFFISLILAAWTSRNHASLSFYAFPTRAWELLAGSIMAYFEINFGKKKKHKILKFIMPSIGMILITHSLFFFSHKTFHPSYYTLSPIIGTCLIIWFSNKDEIITKLLSTRIFNGVGKISYSLYLWHYPLFAFAQMTEFAQGNTVNKILLAFTVLILSIFSYYFIEQPFRSKNKKPKLLLGTILVFILSLSFVNSSIIFKEGYKNRVPQIIQKDLNIKPWNLLKNSKGEDCFNNSRDCKFNTDSNKKIYIIGDSHIAAIMFDLKSRVVKKQYQFITKTFGGCLYFPEFDLITKKTKKINEKCNNEYFQNLKQILSKENNSIIIFGGRLPVYISKYHFNNKEGGVEAGKWDFEYVARGKYKNIQQSFKNEILKLAKKNEIILIYPIPEVGWKLRLKIWLERNNKFNENFEMNRITTSYKVYKERSESSFELLNSIKGINISRIYPHTLFCDTAVKDRCLTHDDEDIFYYDTDHLSSRGAELLNEMLIKEIEKIELKRK